MDSNEQGRYRVLAVFAHPDDESCGPGGTLARCASEGMDVHLICATRGEFGGAPVPDKRPDYLLGELRTGELRAACKALGVTACTILDYPDGLLRDCDQYALERDIARVVRQVRPRIIMTVGFEEERTSDHATVARVTTLAWMAAGASLDNGHAFADGAAPHFADILLHYHSGPPDREHLSRYNFVRVNVSRYRQQKAAALRRHVTQSVCTRGTLQALETDGVIYEYFIIAHSNLPADHQLLTELFEPL